MKRVGRAALLVGGAALGIYLALVVAAGTVEIRLNNGPLAPIPPVWSAPQEITGTQSTGGQGVPAQTVAP